MILEPPPAPDTKAPVTINTQINVQQIPKTAWDRLSPDQVLELSKHILTSMDVIDSRHFEYAMKRAERDDHGKRLSVIVGSLIFAVGCGSSVYLAGTGHDVVAAMIAAPLTTILAVIVGRRFID